MPPQSSVINLDFCNAFDIATKAVNILKAAKRRANIVVVDNRQNVLIYLGMDGTREFTMGVAHRKADQSSSTGERTRTLSEKVKSKERKPGDYGISEASFVPWPGGVPIYDKEGNLLGGIGVSNLTGDEDEGIAIKAVEFMGFASDKPRD